MEREERCRVRSYPSFWSSLAAPLVIMKSTNTNILISVFFLKIFLTAT